MSKKDKSNILICGVNKLLNLPYKIGIIGLAAFSWLYSLFSTYSSNGNFNLFSTVINYVIALSIAGIIYASIAKEKGNFVKKNAIITFIFAFFAIMSVKVFFLQFVGYYILTPLCFFAFFSLMQAIWEDL